MTLDYARGHGWHYECPIGESYFKMRVVRKGVANAAHLVEFEAFFVQGADAVYSICILNW